MKEEYLYRIELLEFFDQGINEKGISMAHFEPRIPYSIIFNDNIPEFNEDHVTKRICFSDSIEGCFTACNLSYIEKIFETNYVNDDGLYFLLFKVKKDDLDKDYLFDYNYLDDNKLVPDAYISHEYWYTKSIDMDGLMCKLTGWSEESEIVLPKHLRGKSDLSEDDYNKYLTKPFDVRIVTEIVIQKHYDISLEE